MKKLILSLALCCAATNFFAQNTDPAQLVNEGKAALESKNYQLAFTKFSTYLTQTNNQDSVIAFNCGVCADKIKKPADALKYFDIAVQKKYNLANAYIGKAGFLHEVFSQIFFLYRICRPVLFHDIDHFADFPNHPKQFILSCCRADGFPFLFVFFLQCFLHFLHLVHTKIRHAVFLHIRK